VSTLFETNEHTVRRNLLLQVKVADNSHSGFVLFRLPGYSLLVINWVILHCDYHMRKIWRILLCKAVMTFPTI